MRSPCPAATATITCRAVTAGISSTAAPATTILDGGGDNDFLVGGPGQDTLSGGLGGDQFIFTALGDGRTPSSISMRAPVTGSNLEALFADSAGFDPTAANAGDFLRFEAFDANGDGVQRYPGDRRSRWRRDERTPRRRWRR